jgi:hypothetical protein
MPYQTHIFKKDPITVHIRTKGPIKRIAARKAQSKPKSMLLWICYDKDVRHHEILFNNYLSNLSNLIVVYLVHISTIMSLFYVIIRVIHYIQGVRKFAVHYAAVYHDHPRTLNELKTVITAYIRNISQADLQKVFANKIKRVQACIDACGHHFQHLL